MRVEVTFTLKVVDSDVFEFSYPYFATVTESAEPAEITRQGIEVQSPKTPVLPLGSSVIAPGLTMAVDY